ncbi:molybdopterin biosynthesis protein [Roseovarius spongiae]|uniref:Molybdopterin biosynthesis protein n=1 Tax=Roseovarius spongiae TaxID=2320272 RepID=A0A3A8B9X1_9RHOB|nr:molybdopterin-binding protein [Roseovarius spongiae]RKF15215.1 molybdopterin biosynthesis protein [Roseovarius spongiae]
MKFGAVPVEEAGGGILAHSIKLPGGRLSKGLIIGPEEVAALRAAGVDRVTVARLEPGDVEENEAAADLARTLAGGAPGVSLGPAVTGRVNLLADRAGIVQLDAARIDAANAVDPMITVATVAPMHQILPGGLIATVKIISYAVPGAALRAAAEHLAGAVRLALPALRSATLIETLTAEGRPAGPPGLGRAAVADRLEALGVDLTETLTAAHEESAIAEALGKASGDLLLILTASATSDPEDVAPAAVRLAGGRVERVGMPVDPGNLLFLGALEKRPVIGLPGCARAPALNGADWVLGRVICGLNVTAADIAAMGVGGLLKEIPTRPSPRRGKG